MWNNFCYFLLVELIALSFWKRWGNCYFQEMTPYVLENTQLLGTSFLSSDMEKFLSNA